MQSVWIVILVGFMFGCQAQSEEPLVLMKTNMGDMKIKLYKETPQHRDNFVKLVEENFYDSLLFHRVIGDFMIQAGDPKSKGAPAGKMLGSGGPGYKIPAEFVPKFYHKKGALSAARQGDRTNPQKESSGSQFYIVQGKQMKPQELNMIEQQLNTKRNSAGIRAYLSQEEHKPLRDEVMKLQQERNGRALDSIAKVIIAKLKTAGKLKPDFKFTDEQRQVYTTLGGTPFLDNEYTVFGEVVEGLDVLDKIAAVETGRGDRPVQDVVILEMKIVKK